MHLCSVDGATRSTAAVTLTLACIRIAYTAAVYAMSDIGYTAAVYAMSDIAYTAAVSLTLAIIILKSTT